MLYSEPRVEDAENSELQCFIFHLDKCRLLSGKWLEVCECFGIDLAEKKHRKVNLMGGRLSVSHNRNTGRFVRV